MMQSVAGGELRGLHGEDQRKALKLLFQFAAFRENAEQELRFDAVGGGVALRDDPQSAGLEPEDDGQADKAFSSNQADANPSSLKRPKRMNRGGRCTKIAIGQTCNETRLRRQRKLRSDSSRDSENFLNNTNVLRDEELRQR